MTATRALTTSSTEYTIGRCRVVVTAGPDAGASASSAGDELAVGSDPANDLVLADEAVSRHHLVIEATRQGFRVRDLSSTNGTRVGDLRVESAYLEPGAVLSLGSTRVRFEVLDDAIREPVSDAEGYGAMLGASAAMRRIFAVLPRIAVTDTTVLVLGETGTGKSALAHAIHAESHRANGPFGVIDCSAIPPTLIESELFGHDKGAFTGAHAARAGAFEAARGGTVFLDEIGELPLDMQPKLLRALEERKVVRVGSTTTVDLDVRIIAATHRDLREAVNRGQFRSDLFYRLNVVKLRIPPLRERREDIPVLAAHFYEQLARDGARLPGEMVRQLLDGDWPGNVRELRSAVERMLLFDDPELWRQLAGGDDADAATADARTPAVELDETQSFRAAKELAVARWERGYLSALLAQHDGNLSAASRAARMDRNYLRELLRRHKLR